MGQTCHTGGTGGEVDLPLPGLLFCPECVGMQSVPGGFSARTLSIGIPPQGTSLGQGYPKMTPYTVLVSRPYTDPPPPSHSPLIGGAVGWHCRAYLRVFTVDGLQATQPPGQLHTQVNGTSGGLSPYSRVPVSSLA